MEKTKVDKERLGDYIKKNEVVVRAMYMRLCHKCQRKVFLKPDRTIKDYCKNCQKIMTELVSKVNHDLHR